MVEDVQSTNKTDIGGLESNPKDKPKSEDDFESISKNEYIRYQFLRILLPFGIIFLIVIVFYNFTNSIFVILAILSPFLYAVIFFVLFEKGAHGMRLYGESDTNHFFKNITFERASLRFYYVQKLLRHTFYASIIIGIIAVITFNLVSQIDEQNHSKFIDLENSYNTKSKELALVNDENLLDYFKTEIVPLKEFSPKRSLIPILEQEIKLQAETSGDLEAQNNPTDKAYRNIDGLNDYELLHMLISKIENKNPNELRIIIQQNLDVIKPNPLGFYTSYGVLKAFLIMIILLPAVMLYSIGFSLYLHTQTSIYHLNLSRGYFLLVLNTTNTDRKRKWICLAILAYESHIKKITEMKIRNMDKILSEIIINPPSEIDLLSKKFHDALLNQDRFELIRSLEQKYCEKNIAFLTKDPFKEKIKDFLSVIIPAITTSLAIFSVVVGR